MLAIVDVGLHGGKNNHQCEDRYQNPEIAPKRAGQADDTADDPYLAAEAVGGVPVFFAGQCPGQFDAHGVGLAALGKQITHNDKQSAYDQRRDDFTGNGITKGGGVDHTAQNQTNAGTDPKYQLHHLGIVIFVFGIRCAGKETNPLHRQHEGRYTENGKTFTAPVIRFTIDAPVDGNGIGKLIPKNQTHDDGDQQHQGCENQGFDILFKQDRYLLSGL